MSLYNPDRFGLFVELNYMVCTTDKPQICKKIFNSYILKLQQKKFFFWTRWTFGRNPFNLVLNSCVEFLNWILGVYFGSPCMIGQYSDIGVQCIFTRCRCCSSCCCGTQAKLLLTNGGLRTFHVEESDPHDELHATENNNPYADWLWI